MEATRKQMAEDLKKHWDNLENTAPPKDYAIYYIWKKYKVSFRECLNVYNISYV